MKYNRMECNKNEALSEKEKEALCLSDELMLVELAKAGDEKAFGRLVEPYMRKAYHMALKITRNREDAEDAAQQGFLKGFAHIHQFQGQSKFSSWLLRIVINETLMKIRQRKSQDHYFLYDIDAEDESNISVMPCTGEAFHPEVLYASVERGHILRKAIDSLQRNSRIVVRLLGLEEKQTAEAALLLNLSRSAVKTRYARARQELRECLAGRV